MILVKKGEPFERALKRFNDEVHKSGVLHIFKEKSFYMSKQEKRRQKILLNKKKMI